jgi:(p)ppGpp synthase/HD superfamily hydrolase
MWSIDDLQAAWELASRLHDGQKYGGSKQGEQIEYLNHIGSVTFEILAAIQQGQGMNANLAIHCAILHDTIEDTDCSFEDIAELFGAEVAAGVMALTKDESIEGKENKIRDSLQRIKQQPREVWAVKLADRICNLSAPPFYWPKEKIIQYQNEARLILDTLREGNAYLAARLESKIAAYDRYNVGIE